MRVLLGLGLVAAALVAAALPIDDRRPTAEPRVAAPAATPTPTPSPRRDVRRAHCPAGVAGCRAVRGTVIFVERVDGRRARSSSSISILSRSARTTTIARR